MSASAAAAVPSATDFLIGFLVSLGASVMNALGLNLLKLDQVKNSLLSSSQQRNECGRPMWHVGLYLYIASQLIGSTIALNFLKTQWVAPLGSIALVFNIAFAKLLVGTIITRMDFIGTFIVIMSVIWIVVFGGMNSGADAEDNLTLDTLKELFLRGVFIIYFGALNLIAIAGLIFSIHGARLVGSPTLKNRSSFFRKMELKRMKKIIGISMALVGGLIASETLLLAKSGVKLFVESISGDNQFTDKISWFIILLLVITAVLQVYCLNSGLKLYSSVAVVPVFYGSYTALGLINSMIYLNEVSGYPGWALFLVVVGIGTLIYGVKLLSSVKPEPSADTLPRNFTRNRTGDTEMGVVIRREKRRSKVVRVTMIDVEPGDDEEEEEEEVIIEEEAGNSKFHRRIISVESGSRSDGAGDSLDIISSIGDIGGDSRIDLDIEPTDEFTVSEIDMIEYAGVKGKGKSKAKSKSNHTQQSSLGSLFLNIFHTPTPSSSSAETEKSEKRSHPPLLPHSFNLSTDSGSSSSVEESIPPSHIRASSEPNPPPLAASRKLLPTSLFKRSGEPNHPRSRSTDSEGEVRRRGLFSKNGSDTNLNAAVSSPTSNTTATAFPVSEPHNNKKHHRASRMEIVVDEKIEIKVTEEILVRNSREREREIEREKEKEIDDEDRWEEIN